MPPQLEKNPGSHVCRRRCSRRVADLDALANECAQITLDRDPAADKEDLITVSIGYGYDIGIASRPGSPCTRTCAIAPVAG
jgi:hypothetical protein